MKLFFAALVVLASCSAPVNTPQASPLPTGSASSTVATEDPCHVAGTVYCALNPDVTPATIGKTICLSGWTATVRPPSAYTSQLKADQMRAFGLPGTAADYEEDHRIPLELGGAPRDPENLTPEPRAGTPNNATTKDTAENLARHWVCDQGADLRTVQADLVSRWLAPWPSYK